MNKCRELETEATEKLKAAQAEAALQSVLWKMVQEEMNTQKTGMTALL